MPFKSYTLDTDGTQGVSNTLPPRSSTESSINRAIFIEGNYTIL